MISASSALPWHKQDLAAIKDLTEVSSLQALFHVAAMLEVFIAAQERLAADQQQFVHQEHPFSYAATAAEAAAVAKELGFPEPQIAMSDDDDSDNESMSEDSSSESEAFENARQPLHRIKRSTPAALEGTRPEHLAARACLPPEESDTSHGHVFEFPPHEQHAVFSDEIGAASPLSSRQRLRTSTHSLSVSSAYGPLSTPECLLTPKMKAKRADSVSESVWKKPSFHYRHRTGIYFDISTANSTAVSNDASTNHSPLSSRAQTPPHGSSNPDANTTLTAAAEKLTIETRQQAALLSRFWLKNVPNISVHDYLLRFHRYCRSSASTYIATGHYLYLASVGFQKLPITRKNVYRLFAAAYVVAAKIVEDVQYPFKRYATTAGLSPTDLGRLEVLFLFLVEFNVSVDREVLFDSIRNLAPYSNPQMLQTASADWFISDDNYS